MYDSKHAAGWVSLTILKCMKTRVLEIIAIILQTEVQTELQTEVHKAMASV